MAKSYLPAIDRRHFLRSLAVGVAGAGSALIAQRSLAAGELPPVRVITRGPKHYWFGYYDKLQFDPTDRLVLGMEVDFEHRSPRADDTIRIGMVDTADADRWIELGQSTGLGLAARLHAAVDSGIEVVNSLERPAERPLRLPRARRREW